MDPMVPEPPDEELMLAYAGGDDGALERLYLRHRGPLFTYVLHHSGRRSLAEDVTQDVFLRIVRGRASYSRRGSFRAWIYTIARNLIVDARRRNRTRADSEGSVQRNETAREEGGPRSPVDEALTQDPAADPDRRSESLELGRRIRAALQRLPDEQREVFLLRERAGLDFRAIAEVTGVGLATVKSRMRYALAGLRERLQLDAEHLLEVRHDRMP